MRRRSQHGFTVIELAMVVAVSAVMAALALSAYRTHSVRTEVSRSLEAAAEATRLVERAFGHDGQAPADRRLAATDGVIAAVELVAGRVDLTYGDDAPEAVRGRRLSLTPYETADLKVVWVCGNEIPGMGLNPLGFAGGGRQAEQVSSTIDPRFLPAHCR